MKVAPQTAQAAVADSRELAAPVALGERWLAAWEIASVTLSFLIVMWLVWPLARNRLFVGLLPLLFAGAVIWLSHRARGETAHELGWRLDNFARALRLLLLPMLGAAAVIILTGWLSGGLRSGKPYIWRWVLWLPVWGLLQQYVLQGFINRRAQLICGRGIGSVLLVAATFAVLHLPNPWLSVATFGGGFICAWVYQRVPNLFALALAHAAMSLLLVWALPPPVLKSLRIGFKYFG